MWVRHADHRRGQTMVELALILPLFLSVLFGIVILGIGVFYQQQVTLRGVITEPIQRQQ